MASTLGPFHSLIDADKHRLTELIQLAVVSMLQYVSSTPTTGIA